MTITELSPRQQDIIRSLAKGLTNKQIALELGIREETVKNHLHLAMIRVGACSRLELVFMLFDLTERG